MDYFTKHKVLFWCVVVLMILNIVTITSFWVGKGKPRPGAGLPDQRDGRKIMQEKLQLSDEQASKLEELREEHFKRTRPLQEQMHKIKLDLLNELFAADPNSVKIEHMLGQLEQKSGEFERQLFNHFQQLHDLCNPEQDKELKRMLVDLIESTRPRDPRRKPMGPAGELGPGRRPPRRQ